MSYPGINGKPGVQSPSLNIMSQQIVGTLQIKLQGSDGSNPEAGGNGRAGNDMTSTPPSLSKAECCGTCYIWSYDDKFCKGKSGYSGEGGNDGRAAGISRNGGSTGSVTVYSESVSGFVTLQQNPGYGGIPAEHGYGGKGGNGGDGGCGFKCIRGYWCEGIVCKHRCSDHTDCDNRGAHGNAGLPGNDGFSLYGVPTQGQMGGVGNSDLR
uniref:Uncharacterized protein n=1 Tax=Ciona savignyi TaxID=51511 RepID=H2ZKL5_CIOSA